MQDVHSIPSPRGGRLLSSSTSTTTVTTTADRRLRSPHHRLNPQPAALKCPRCDSLNTKFCYYNNYNLSQPRHFCKSCRRYWTKGGVLRNVPIGGGCRKTKRSKPKRTPPLSSSGEILPLPSPPPPSTSSPATEVKKSSPHSSSDSSTLTAITAASTTTEAVSSKGSLMSFQFSKYPDTNPGFEANLVENQTDEDGVLVNMESLTSLMRTSSELEQLQLPFDGSYNGFLEHEENQWNQPQEIITGNSVHVEVDLPVLGSRLDGENGGEFGPLDYDDQDQGLFDQLTSGFNQACWNHPHQWNDGLHPTLHFPP